MSAEPILTYRPQTEPPALRLPALACDSHVHLFGPAARFPYAEPRAFTPVDAPKEALFAMHRTLGIERCVMVQSILHGYDNRVLEDAIAVSGGRYLGVALVPLDVSDAELQRLAQVGFRGVRFHFMADLTAGHPVQEVMAFTRRLAPLGLHLQVHFEASAIHELAPWLAQSAVPVVVDHMGRVDASLGPQHRDFAALMELMKLPHLMVKVSGVDRVCPQPPYAPGVLLARTLVTAYPQRVLWGSDWPHPFHTHVPNDTQLLELLAQIAPEQQLLQQLMVDNPARFYRFASA